MGRGAASLLWKGTVNGCIGGFFGRFRFNCLLCPGCPIKINGVEVDMTLTSLPRAAARRRRGSVPDNFFPRTGDDTHALSRTRLLVHWLVDGGNSVRLLLRRSWRKHNNGNSTSNDNGNQAGVAIDAEGVLRVKTFGDPGGQLMRERIAAAKATLDPKVASFSKLRKISLNRLEQAILDHQGTLTDEMRYLAGLLRVRYVFYYPESKDIVLAGPAEGWVADPAGRVVGITTRPARRAVAGSRRGVAGVSARRRQDLADRLLDRSDPGRPGRDAALPADQSPEPQRSPAVRRRLRNSLGYQLVSINGVAPKTHFAQVMVEADYRMKLIGIGLERPPVRMVSYVDRARPGEVSRNAMQRWFFVPDYQCVRQSDDKLAMELVGDGVKLVGEDEMVMGNGERKAAAGRGNKASQEFVVGFTKQYPELAERSPVYAELRNLIDLAIAAAYIQEQGYYDKAGWKMPFFGSEQEFPVEIYNIPKTVESAVNAIWKGHTLHDAHRRRRDHPGRPRRSKDDNLLADKKGKVAKIREGVKLNLAKGQWWWD